jgi:deazaflavin-dependent oxidoreductase (nitroreductase family)
MSDATLPYGPIMTRLLEPMRRGFLVVNRRLTAPMLRAGLGPLLTTPATGSMLLLRTTGRTSGLVREAPLGYALVDGRIMVVAGYGRAAHWFRNALAHPHVEVVLPGAVISGVAEEVTDPLERRRALRATIRAMGVVGRWTLGDLDGASDDRVDELARAFPVLAVTPMAVLDGPFDPGAWFPAANAAAWVALTGAACWAIGRAVRRSAR